MTTVKTATKKAVTTDQILNHGNKPNKAKKPTAKKQVTNNNVQDVAAMQEEIKRLQEQVKEAKKANPKQVIYLANGVTGKQLQRNAKGTKEVINSNLHSLSFCLNTLKKYVNKDGSIFNPETQTRETVPAFTKSFPNAKVSDITPANVLKYRTEKQLEAAKLQLAKYGYERFTIAQVLGWLTKHYKAINGYVVKAGK